MFAIAAAIIFALEGLKVIESTTDITWWLIGLALLALAVVFDPMLPTSRYFRRQ